MPHATRTRSKRSDFRFSVVVQTALIGSAAASSCSDAETAPWKADIGAAGAAADSGSTGKPVDSGSSAAIVDSDSTENSNATPPTVDLAQANYEVPVSVSLAPFARYPIGSVSWAVKGGRRRLEYQLPADLIGTAQTVEFKGPDTTTTTWSLTGEPFGTADCSLIDQQVVCQEHLAGVPIDLAAVEARVNAGQLAPQRLEVAKVFQGDPIGVLRFPAN